MSVKAFTGKILTRLCEMSSIRSHLTLPIFLSLTVGGGEGREREDCGAEEEGPGRLHPTRDHLPGHSRHLPRHGQPRQALREVRRAFRE